MMMAREADIYHKVSGENNVLHVKLDKPQWATNPRCRGLTIRDDLSYYRTLAEKQQRLQQIQNFSFLGSLCNPLINCNLDTDQKRAPVSQRYRDYVPWQNQWNSSIRVLAPTELRTPWWIWDLFSYLTGFHEFDY